MESIDRVAISGLTAAGKTTHTRLLAEEFGLRPLHFTDLLLDELGISAREDVWLHRLHEIESMRIGGLVDARVDAAVRHRLHTEPGLVVDSLIGPWAGPPSTLRIWIGSDRLSRAWKCRVSHWGRATLDSVAGSALIDEKDGLSRQVILRDHSVDIYADRSCFDFVFDNSHLISAPTAAASQEGIRRFQRVLSACTSMALIGDAKPLLELLAEEQPELNAAIVKLGHRMLALLPPGAIGDDPRIPSRLI